MPKPFDLNHLERIVRDTLGPVQVEIKPKAAPEEVMAQPPVAEKTKVEEAKVEEIIAIAPVVTLNFAVAVKKL